MTPVLFVSYTLELSMDEKEAEKKRSLRNEKLKANRISETETEEQRKERRRIRHENDRARRRRKEKVARHRRLRETAPGHSQKIEAR